MAVCLRAYHLLQGAAVAWFVRKLQRARLETAWSDWLAGLDFHASNKCVHGTAHTQALTHGAQAASSYRRGQLAHTGGQLAHADAHRLRRRAHE